MIQKIKASASSVMVPVSEARHARRYSVAMMLKDAESGQVVFGRPDGLNRDLKHFNAQ